MIQMKSLMIRDTIILNIYIYLAGENRVEYGVEIITLIHHMVIAALTGR
mgnify:FL=1